jgi:hypothetical protein
VKAQDGYFSCHKIFFTVSVLAIIILLSSVYIFIFEEVQREHLRFPLLPHERVSVRYIASIVSSWVPGWKSKLAIHHCDDARDL